MKTALIIGQTGQDGSYATELLHSQGYRVIGAVRAAGRIGPVAPDAYVLWDMRDGAAFAALLSEYEPDEVYNFAAYSSGSGMFDDPIGMGQVNGLAITLILEALRGADRPIRFCQASSSEMFGSATQTPQNELTPFCPRTPYGAAKVYAHNMIGIYRKAYGVFACSAILFNHESPRRGLAFVTRKIVHEAARIKMGLTHTLQLGNLDARRDWGFAGDYVRAMWLMLQQENAEDYVIGTGQVHSVRDVCETVFRHFGLDYRDYVRGDITAYRQPEAVQLVGDVTKARLGLGWQPEVDFEGLLRRMADSEVAYLQNTANS
jgi:GDPmannose 4,6-dehydratase